MQIMALHGEVACYGLTGAAGGQIGFAQADPSNEGAYAFGPVSAPSGHFIDTTLWAYEGRKDQNGNGGRYVFGERYTYNPSASFRPRTQDGSTKELWFRMAVHGPSATQPNSAFQVWTSSVSEPSWHVQVSFNGGSLLAYAAGGLVANVPIPWAWLSNEWHVLEVFVRINAVNGRIVVYGDFDYSSPLINYTGNTYYNAFAAQPHIEKIFVSRGTVLDSALEDIKAQNATFRNMPDEIFVVNGQAWDDGNVPTLLAYDLASASAATSTITVHTFPLPAGSLTLNGQVMTGVSGARTPGVAEFSIDGGTTVDDIAQSIADCINDSQLVAEFGSVCSAAVVGGGSGQVTLTHHHPGTLGNSTTVATSYTPGSQLTFGVFGGGIEGNFVGQGSVWNLGFTNAADARWDKTWELWDIEDALTLEWNGFDHTLFTNVYLRALDTVSGDTASIRVLNDRMDRDSGFCGDSYYYEAIAPDGVGAVTQLTRGGADTGNNWDQVNDGVRADAEGSYNYSLATGLYDAYTFENFSIPDAQLDLVRGVTLYTRSKKTSEALGTEIPLMLSGAVGGSAGNHVLGTGYQVKYLVFPEDINGMVDWTATAINALQMGTMFK